jgi:hypothetical protein
MNKLIRVIVTKSSCPYVPLNVECQAVIKNGKLLTCHRIDTGAGTYLNGNEKIEYKEIN